MSENETGVAVATTVDAPTDKEIERIREAGAKAVAHRREMSKVAKQIEGLEWGKGYSPMTRATIAEFVQVTRANPVIHIDVLGGKIYLNAEFWADRIRTDPYFYDYEQYDISRSVEDAIRERAARMHERADTFAEGSDEHRKWKSRAYELEDEADDLNIRRARWSAPADVECVVETVIMRFINAAPLDEIRAGRISGETLEGYIVEVRECNWAGGLKQDPVGNTHPAKSARTRSLRRCANKAFSAWMQNYESQITKAEEYLEAEWEVVSSRSHDNQTLQITEGEGGEIVSDSQADLPTEAGGDDFDYDDARKRMFATLKDAGITEKQRKAWYAENGLPGSTKEFTPDDYARVQTLLVDPVKAKVRDRLDGDVKALEDLSLRVLEKSQPEYLRDWVAILAVLESQGADEDEEGGDEQAPLDL